MGAWHQDTLADWSSVVTSLSIWLWLWSRPESRVEAESNTSTVDPRIVGGDGNGRFESERVKCGHEFHGTWIWEWLHWRGLAAKVNGPVLSSEGEHHTNKFRNRLTIIKIWSQSPDACFIPRQTGRLTVGRNITFTFILKQTRARRRYRQEEHRKTD
jgi:hypothetical protein